MIYRAINFTIENISLNAAVVNTFVATIDGDTCDAYRLRIYLSGSQIYDSTKQTLSPVLFDGEQLSINLPSGTLTNGNTYTYTIECFEGTESAVSQFIQFYADAPPTVGLTFPSPIVSQNIQLQATYFQANNVLMASYRYLIKDSNGNTLYDFTKNASQDTRYTVEGLPNNISGTIEFSGTTTRGFNFTTGELAFTVDYPRPSVNITPSTTLNRTSSFVTYRWGVITQISGTATGTISYVPNYIVNGNTALNIHNNSRVVYNLDFGENFTLKYKLDLSTGFDGKICELTSDTGQLYGLYWESANNRFYWDNDGIRSNSMAITVPIRRVYIVVLPQRVYVKIGDTIYDISNFES